MKLWMKWVGHKKCAAGRDHLWGILVEEGARDTKHYIFHGECASGSITFRPTDKWSDGLHRLKNTKVEEGYKQIHQSKVETKWPQVMDDIEMQFMMQMLAK